MKLTIDETSGGMTVEEEGKQRRIDLYSTEGFELLSKLWLKAGWNEKYIYTFTWLGRPIIQLPDDMFRIQEVIYQVKPDVILETGVAHGGSLVFYATLCKALGKGRVIGVDVEIRPHNRKAIEEHELRRSISLIEGDSVNPSTVERVRAAVRPGEAVLVILDSCHRREHVLAELEAYGPLVTPGSYIVATDGIMRDLWAVPRGQTTWKDDHPAAAVEEFARRHPEFVVEQPAWMFNESRLKRNVTHWPTSYLKRVS